jgi:hypothetical protein
MAFASGKIHFVDLCRPNLEWISQAIKHEHQCGAFSLFVMSMVQRSL